MRLLLTGTIAVFLVALWFHHSETRRQLVADAPSLPVRFAHADHREENCIGCHHNFADGTGDGLCLNCHEDSQAVGHLLELHFHGLCRGCHIKRQAAGADRGPVRRCGDCHAIDSAHAG